MRGTSIVLLVTLLAACAKGSQKPDTTATKTDTAMSGMAGMAGMGAMMSGGMMDSMAVQMRMMDTMTGAQMKAMMPAHRQMVANLLSQMSSEMRGMNMTAEPKWTALMDSVRQDLVRMPDLTPQQCKEMMPAHHGRMTRLMQLHRDMVAGMKK